MTHIIQKQVLELTMEEHAEKMQLQEDVVLRFRKEVLPAITELFDRLAPEDFIWRIDRLELNLGAVRPEGLKSKVLEEMEKMLQNHFQSASQNVLEIIRTEQGLIQQFMHFLRYGHFSWNANGIDLEQMEKELPQSLGVMDPIVKKELLVLFTLPKILRRLQAWFSQKLLNELVLHLIPVKDLSAWQQILRVLLPEVGRNKLTVLMLNTYARHPGTELIEYIEAVLTQIREEHQDASPSQPSFDNKLRELVKRQKPSIAKTLTKVLERWGEGKSEALVKTENTGSDPEISEEGKEEIYIKNAGLILLWPYLQRFFDNLKLLHNGEFADHMSREKAVCILQHLAWPDLEIAENYLPLNKILCGMDVVDLVIADEAVISEQEANKGNELLEAVIRNWSGIGHTSVRGFQTSFLQREGRLSKTGEGWALKVEQRSFDVLLNSLPWSITLIKLPWMPKPMQVEW